jgi:hypothetical protein
MIFDVLLLKKNQLIWHRDETITGVMAGAAGVMVAPLEPGETGMNFEVSVSIPKQSRITMPT